MVSERYYFVASVTVRARAEVTLYALQTGTMSSLYRWKVAGMPKSTLCGRRANRLTLSSPTSEHTLQTHAFR